jgi:uridine kinase
MKAPIVVIISGPGGIGKTRLARLLVPFLVKEGFTVKSDDGAGYLTSTPAKLPAQEIHITTTNQPVKVPR